jgi:hypothetical protein
VPGNGRILAPIGQKPAALILDLERKARTAMQEIKIMNQDIKTERRWLRSVIAASAEPLPTFPWMRGQRRKPVALKPAEGATEAKTSKVALFGHSGAIAAR